MMVEASPIRAISRMTGASKNTIGKIARGRRKSLLGISGPDVPQPDVQARSGRRNLVVRRLEAKECSHQKSAVGFGYRRRVDVDGDLILKPSSFRWHIGRAMRARLKSFYARCRKQARRSRPDDDRRHGGLSATPSKRLSRTDIDYAKLVKIYGDATEAEKRYSPAVASAQIQDRWRS